MCCYYHTTWIGGDAKSKIEDASDTFRELTQNPRINCDRQCKSLKGICANLIKKVVDNAVTKKSCTRFPKCKRCLVFVMRYLNKRYRNTNVHKGYAGGHYVDDSENIGYDKTAWKAYNLAHFPFLMDELNHATERPVITWLSGHSNNWAITIKNFATLTAKQGTCKDAAELKIANGGVLAVKVVKTAGTWKIVKCKMILGSFQPKKRH